MRKLLLLVGILVVVMVFSGCQQTGLSETEIRDLVGQEVVSYEQEVRELVELEVAKQISDIEILKVSSLHIVNEDGNIVASLSSFMEGGGYLFLHNADGERVASLDSIFSEGSLALSNSSGETIISLGTDMFTDGGVAAFYDKNGQLVFMVP